MLFDGQEKEMYNNQTIQAIDDHNSIFCLGNILKIVFLIFFALAILTFPIDEVK